MGIAPGKPIDGNMYDTRIRDFFSPSRNPPTRQTRRTDRVKSSADPSRRFASRPTPFPDVTATTIHLPQYPTGSQEVSYIEWDDDDGRRGKSAFERIKKSFTDLRAAERYITEVGHRTQAAGTPPGSPTFAVVSGIDRAPVAILEPGAIKSQTPLKLRKKASTRNISTSARRSDTTDATPPSTCKRKRTNTTSSQRSWGLQKKSKDATVGQFVWDLIGARKEH
ncbi:hypothetical protein A1O7_00031 [Cladophialophora yegresii CBS 114405]|uniref:Uncharacterized protein n=1 Tax=Cladophialophora yegresii CBS 114405 TaxID=1182544 RepID=W9WGI5_9EURO|nr:uncharacterized protein A1O7_00031 [Cladophialophora yegresii CBS 114405]EXJ63696.1 hypothetical protein A1O7_00031 [Cladophialophora yegresii CBS 114405]